MAKLEIALKVRTFSKFKAIILNVNLIEAVNTNEIR